VLSYCEVCASKSWIKLNCVECRRLTCHRGYLKLWGLSRISKLLRNDQLIWLWNCKKRPVYRDIGLWGCGTSYLSSWGTCVNQQISWYGDRASDESLVIYYLTKCGRKSRLCWTTCTVIGSKSVTSNAGRITVGTILGIRYIELAIRARVFINWVWYLHRRLGHECSPFLASRGRK